MGIARTAAVSALALLLGGCGGGGGGNDDGGSSSGAEAAQGFYVGDTSNGRAVSTLILPSGAVWSLYSTQANDDIIAGFVRGTVTDDGAGHISGSGGRDYNLEGLGVSTISSVTGNYVAQDSIFATINYGGGTTVTVDGLYDDAYEDLPTRAVIAGSYGGNVSTTVGSDTFLMSITSSGALTGNSVNFDCDFVGSVDPRGDSNAYTFEVEFENGTECAAPGDTVRGIAIYNPTGLQLIGAAEADDRSDGAVFVANRF